MNEIDLITQTTRPMGILEIIEQEVIKQTTEKTEKRVTKLVTRKVTKEVTAQILKENIQKLSRKGFSVESISEMLEEPFNITQDAVK